MTEELPPSPPPGAEPSGSRGGPTIDLTAEEVTAAAPPDAAAPSPTAAPSFLRTRAGQVLAAVVALEGVALLALAGWIGVRDFMPAEPSTPPALQEMTALRGQIEGQQAVLQSLNTRAAAADTRLETLARTATQLAARPAAPDNAEALAALRQRLDGVTRDVAAAARSVTALEDRTNARLSALETRAAEPAPPPTSDRPALRKAVTALGLAFAVERGLPYAAELGAARAAFEPVQLAPLEPFAAQGVPSAAALAASLQSLKAPADAAAPASDSLLDRLAARAAALARVTPADRAAQGAAPTLAEAKAAAAQGDLKQAAMLLARMDGPARQAAEPWLRQNAAREAALAAARALAAEAVATAARDGAP